jgi:hypothetical protein
MMKVGTGHCSGHNISQNIPSVTACLYREAKVPVLGCNPQTTFFFSILVQQGGGFSNVAILQGDVGFYPCPWRP